MKRSAPLAPADGLIALAFAAAYVALLLATAGDLGYARDEGFYFFAANRYGAWFQALLEAPRAALDPRSVDAAWSVNHEHPGLIKSLFALSNLVLQKRLGLFAMEGTSYRFPAMVLSGLGVALVYLWGTQARDRLAGASAAVLFAMLPRYFYQAHLACFDAADRDRLGPVRLRLLALAAGRRGAVARAHRGRLRPRARHEAQLLVLADRLRLARRRHGAQGPDRRARDRGEGGARGRRRGVACAARRRPATAGRARRDGDDRPLVFYALWPWIWRDTLPRLREYASFHLNHEYYNMEFLGRNYWTPPMPRAYAPVMTAATVPVVTLGLFAAGLCAAARERLLYPLACAAARLAPKAGGSRSPRSGRSPRGSARPRTIPAARRSSGSSPSPRCTAPGSPRARRSSAARSTG